MSTLDYFFEPHKKSNCPCYKEKEYGMTWWTTLHIRNSIFITYLLEDEYELSLGMLIRLQCIYNLWSIHVVLLSFLDVLQSFYSNFISFFGNNLLTQCPVPVVVFACFLHRRKSISNGVQTLQNFLWIFYGPEGRSWALVAPGGCPEGGTTHQGALGGPGALVGYAHLGCPPDRLFAL